MFMFEQITPPSNCCLESSWVFYFGLGRLSGRMEPKCVRKREPGRPENISVSLSVDFSNGGTGSRRGQKPSCNSGAAASESFGGQLSERRLDLRVRRLPLCQTGAGGTRAAPETIPSSNLTGLWSRHRNPLALKKLPPSLCLTSNGAFFSSLSFFMFVCKVLYIT